MRLRAITAVSSNGSFCFSRKIIRTSKFLITFSFNYPPLHEAAERYMQAFPNLRIIVIERHMKLLKILLVFLITIQSSAQKIEGIYKYQSKEVAFEIEIINDSSYVSRYFGKISDCGYSNSNKIEKSGKINKKGRLYLFREYDSVSKRFIEYPVKITKKKLTYYGYNPKNIKKLVKGFELKKASI